jgi:hypothetical protein
MDLMISPYELGMASRLGLGTISSSLLGAVVSFDNTDDVEEFAAPASFRRIGNQPLLGDCRRLALFKARLRHCPWMTPQCQPPRQYVLLAQAQA